MVVHQNQLNHQIQEIVEALQSQANHQAMVIVAAQVVAQLPSHHIVLTMETIVCPVVIWVDGLIVGKK